ncbi:RNA polymerase sigma factor [Streptomyces capoamus]|uniref:RNA polymerase sigma factor n=1 Tax=Streptomyces capoamus TaxID=68183 RepID=UPI003399CFC4
MHFAQFFEATYSKAMAYLVASTRLPPHAAEEVAADTYLALYHRWREAGAPAKPIAYLYTALRHAAMKRHAHQQRERPTSLADFPDIYDARQRHQLDQVETSQALLEMLSRLPARQRQLMSLRYLMDLPTDRIAELTGLTRSAVRAHLSNARHTLQQIWHEREAETG